MLRSLVLILLLVNAAFFAWSQGWLNSMVGVKPDGQREPQRLQLQQHADQLLLVSPVVASASQAASASAAVTSAASTPAPALPAPNLAAKQADLLASVAQVTASSAASTASTPSSAALVCLESGPFNDAEAKQWQARVQPLLPTGGARTDTVSVPGVWMVFMGPYPDDEQLHRKQGELHRMKGVAFEELRGMAGFSPGLVLGRFKTRGEADARLDTLKLRGIRTARVVAERPPAEVQLLRVPQATPTQQQALAKLGLPAAKAFTACRP